uniref:Uncharacterized protein n=1 Tax=Timema cristinae TaxID=61476 RepID=A0A7R9HET1_TIMCR|nr:unnamed protein product [Timema cristinae]
MEVWANTQNPGRIILKGKDSSDAKDQSLLAKSTNNYVSSVYFLAQLDRRIDRAKEAAILRQIQHKGEIELVIHQEEKTNKRKQSLFLCVQLEHLRLQGQYYKMAEQCRRNVEAPIDEMKLTFQHKFNNLPLREIEFHDRTVEETKAELEELEHLLTNNCCETDSLVMADKLRTLHTSVQELQVNLCK